MIFIESLPVVLRIKQITRGMQPSSDLLEFSRYDLARFGNLMFAIFVILQPVLSHFSRFAKLTKLINGIKRGLKMTIRH